ncbi:hypothetical protein MNV49_006099 [Pseudohyphozyma bogoriensis]|nr:hypothetical protein MNV49_006099 [Pseudohyphozyma bogoriensis]
MITTTTTTTSPLFVVVGATGAQGGSVIKHLIASSQAYRIRGLTRDPTKPAAQALAEKGVEVVKAEISSADDVAKAFEGADCVFANTNFWETFSAEKEFEAGKILVDAAKAAGVKLFVLSGFESPANISGGKHSNVPQMEGKASITTYAKSSGIPLAVVSPGTYLSGFVTQMVPRKHTEDGPYVLALPAAPSTLLPVLDTERDYGAYVVEAVEVPGFGAGSEVLAASEYISLEDIATQWSEVTGKTIVYQELPDSVFVQFVPQGGEQFADMFRFMQNFGYYGGKDLAPSQEELASHVVGFREFAEAQDWSKIIA